MSEYTTKFSSLINIVDGNIGIYAKKEYKDFRFELAPSKKFNIGLPVLSLNNREYKPKLNVLVEDNIFKSIDPLPKDIEKQIKVESTIFM